MKSRALVCLLVIAVGFSVLGSAKTADRITSSLNAGAVVALKGNVHGLAKPEYDLGRADNNRLIEGISLAFRPSAAQQKDLDQFLRQLGDRTSPNYHKYLTPAQFGARFGMSPNDIAQVTSWLVSQGFANIKVANGRNQVSFDGTIAQIESAFSVEMHNYLVNGETHFANAGAPSIPAGMAGSVIEVGHLHDFAPKPRAKVRPSLTSYVSGNHFLSPTDFATIYDLQPLYTAGIDGTGQKIAIIGQSSVSSTDLSNFRSAAGLPAGPPVVTTTAGGTLTQCSGDEGESDLDLEWSGGVAKNATILFIAAGLNTGDTCTGSRVNSVWNALQYAVDNNVAPFISTSYGFCESGLGTAFAGPNGTVEGWAKQGQTQGQTIVSATGDAGAADCEQGTTSATTGLAVDAPASIPEVTGAGGNEFTGDVAGTVSGTPPNTIAAADAPYWAASGTGSDVVSTALEYIPEMAWNDTAADITAGGGLSASGGGASIYYSKPTWQTGTGVPADSKRDVPDISVTASANHDGYLVCSTDTDSTSCASGFRDSNTTTTGPSFTIVGGTSAAAPTFSAILALVNQYVGSAGLAPLNPTLYALPGNSPAPFHDITTGDNKVPCTAPSTNCPTGTTSIGFSAGVGYDQATGLGSVDGYNFAQIMKRAPTTLTVSPSATSVNLGTSVTFTATVTPSTATGTVNFFNNGSTTVLGAGTIASGTATFSTTSLPLGSNSVSAAYAGDTADRISSSATPAVVSTSTSFTLSPAVTTLAVTQGQTSAALTIVVTSSAGFVVTSGSSSQTLLPVTYTCSGLPSEATCAFSPSSTSSATNVSLTITTTAPTGKLLRPLDRGPNYLYAVLLPGLFGIVVTLGSRRRSLNAIRMLALIAVLGLSTLWMASCGGSSSGNKNPGTPIGSYPIAVNATTGGTTPVTGSVKFTLTVQ